MINKIKCFFGFHDFPNWILVGFIPKEGSTKSKRTCSRCGYTETLKLRRDK